MHISSPAHAFAWRISIGFALCLIATLTLYAQDANAGDGCHWGDDTETIYCKSGYWGLGTGCLGLKNTIDGDVRFKTDSKDDENVKRRLKKGHTQRADFKPSLFVHSCKHQVDGKWKDVLCGNVMKIVKNTAKDGGCGCKNFKCLPSW